MRKAVVAMGILLLVVATALVWREAHKPTLNISGITLFSSSECIHCQQVETFVTDNGINQQIAITQKDITIPANLVALNAAVQFCQIDSTQGIGLPLLLAEGKCYVGGPQVEMYLRQKIGLTITPAPSDAAATGSSQLSPTITSR